MKIKIIAIAKFNNLAYKEIFQEYQKRLKNVEICEINTKLSNKLSKIQVKEEEGKLITENLSKNSLIIACDEKGKQLSSLEFADFLEKKSQSHQNIDFIIGGAFGLSPEIIAKSNFKISFSRMTFAHMMARIFLIEQIYRAFSIINNHPYHKE